MAPSALVDRSRLRALLVSGAAVALTSCAVQVAASALPQRWDDERWGPVVPHASFPADCSICHVTSQWSQVRDTFTFDHSAQAGTPLVGAHAQAACLRCHNDRGPVRRFADLGCRGCHVDVHRGSLGDRCADCHGERSWAPEGVVARHLEDGFLLLGAHAATSCDGCHPGARSQSFRGAPRDCLACHQQDQRRATSPDHVASGYVDCERCHETFTWDDARFDHASFPLAGGHAGVDCGRCHQGGVFEGTPRACSACHQQEYQATSRPNHAAAGFGASCEQCHTVMGWAPATFAHTAWPLTGAHTSAACAGCHAGGAYAGTPRDCVACHQQEYQATTSPNHAALGMPTTCDSCHTTTTWQGARFDHTTFPLTGAHAATACASCHAGGVYRGTPRDCAACHASDYQATTDPPHQAAGYPMTCEQCHDTVAWGNATLNHSFPITSGKHAGFRCADCHTTPSNFRAFSCTDCHEHSATNAASHHGGVSGYQWSSSACYSCHPDGRE